MHFNQGIESPSWVIGDQVLAAGAKGVLFNSAITGGANLVIYTDALTGADAINVYDPNNDLPKNQSSW
jgi:thiazole synthase ThiGH ThiG subunit